MDFHLESAVTGFAVGALFVCIIGHLRPPKW